MGTVCQKLDWHDRGAGIQRQYLAWDVHAHINPMISDIWRTGSFHDKNIFFLLGPVQPYQWSHKLLTACRVCWIAVFSRSTTWHPSLGRTIDDCSVGSIMEAHQYAHYPAGVVIADVNVFLFASIYCVV